MADLIPDAPVMGALRTPFIGTDRPKDKTIFDMIEEFHVAFGHPVNGFINRKQIELRTTLIMEETSEALEELDAEPNDVDKIKLTKELADVLYVVIGTAVAFGLPLEKAFKEVHRSNMSKLGADGKPILREDGKVLKGPNYSEADIGQFLS
jgi:NTP pyrophosphatase (non-canonical NTP hydrolase)